VKLIIALVKGLIQALPNIDKALETIILAIINALKGTDAKLKQMGMDIIQGLINGITRKAGEVAAAAANIANGIAKKIGGILKLGSPSKLLIEMGENTGEGLAIGMEHSIKKINNMASQMAQNAIPELNMGNANAANNSGNNRTMNVNINSPKALNAREANMVWNRTMKKMQLQW